MKLPIYQVDAFASEVFSGNPAVICCLDEWLDDSALQAIAVEHNISTTAFLVNRKDHFGIRYFSPLSELPFVGHASLAAAHVVLRLLQPDLPGAILRWGAGELAISKIAGDLLAIRLPAVAMRPCVVPLGTAEALGVEIREFFESAGQYFAVVENESEVAKLAPSMEGLMKLDRDSVVVTAPGVHSEFVSRAFAPKEGLPEDPVCGSAHLALVPYWSHRLGRNQHHALQLSPRGGELFCSLEAGQVQLAGKCALYMTGLIHT